MTRDSDCFPKCTVYVTKTIDFQQCNFLTQPGLHFKIQLCQLEYYFILINCTFCTYLMPNILYLILSEKIFEDFKQRKHKKICHSLSKNTKNDKF